MKFDWTHLQNYALWVAVASFALQALLQYGFNINATGYWLLVYGFLGILVLLGILNNPSSQSTAPLQQPKPIDTLQAPGSITPSAFQTGEQVLAESIKAP